MNKKENKLEAILMDMDKCTMCDKYHKTVMATKLDGRMQNWSGIPVCNVCFNKKLCNDYP